MPWHFFKLLLSYNAKLSYVILSVIIDDDSESWFSIFPIENEALLYGKWENDVIWDAQAMTHIPKPPMMTLDPNDENIILGIPDDRDPEEQKHSTQIQTKKEKV